MGLEAEASCQRLHWFDGCTVLPHNDVHWAYICVFWPTACHSIGLQYLVLATSLVTHLHKT